MQEKSGMEPASYRHTQIGYLIIAVIGAAAAVSYAIVGPGAGPFRAIYLLLGLVLALFYKLSIVVEDGWLRASFGLGLIRRRVDLREVREVRVVRSPWYYGWGLRWIPRGWLWRVSGFRTVELEFDNWRRFQLGSDEPEKLAEALRRRLAPRLEQD